MLLRNLVREKLLSNPSSSEPELSKALFFNILPAKSFLAVFYPDFFRGHGTNSSVLKDLEITSGIFPRGGSVGQNRLPAGPMGGIVFAHRWERHSSLVRRGPKDFPRLCGNRDGLKMAA
jgi:hypothetical protein